MSIPKAIKAIAATIAIVSAIGTPLAAQGGDQDRSQALSMTMSQDQSREQAQAQATTVAQTQTQAQTQEQAQTQSGTQDQSRDQEQERSQDRLRTGAQATDPEQEELRLARSIAVRTRELARIEAILDKDEEALIRARAEVQIVQARIARALLDRKPDLQGVEAMVREGLDWELKARMIQVERQVAIRELLGDERWAETMKLLRGRFSQPGEFGAAIEGRDAAVLLRLRAALSRLR